MKGVSFSTVFSLRGAETGVRMCERTNYFDCESFWYICLLKIRFYLRSSLITLRKKFSLCHYTGMITCIEIAVFCWSLLLTFSVFLDHFRKKLYQVERLTSEYFIHKCLNQKLDWFKTCHVSLHSFYRVLTVTSWPHIFHSSRHRPNCFSGLICRITSWDIVSSRIEFMIPITL